MEMTRWEKLKRNLDIWKGRRRQRLNPNPSDEERHKHLVEVCRRAAEATAKRPNGGAPVEKESWWRKLGGDGPTDFGNTDMGFFGGELSGLGLNYKNPNSSQTFTVSNGVCE